MFLRRNLWKSGLRCWFVYFIGGAVYFIEAKYRLQNSVRLDAIKPNLGEKCHTLRVLKLHPDLHTFW